MIKDGQIETKDAPKPVGPYCQARQTGTTLYLSGQIGIEPETNTLCSEKTVLQLEQCLKNITSVLSAAGATWDDVVKVTIYLTDMKDFSDVNHVYGTHLNRFTKFPARTTVQVAGLPLGAGIELDCIAVLPISGLFTCGKSL